MKYPSGHKFFGQNKPVRAPNSPFRVTIAAICLLTLSDSFWQFLGFVLGFGVDMAHQPTGIIIKAAIFSIGLIGFIISWERGIRIIGGLWVLIFLIILSYVSAIWSTSPLDTIRGAILLVLLVIFALALAINLENRQIAIATAIASILIVCAGLGFRFFANSEQVEFAQTGADLGFALIACVWVFYIERANRVLWFCAALIIIGLTFYLHVASVFGAAFGLVFAFTFNLIQNGKLTRAQKYAAGLVAIIIGLTSIALLRGFAISENLNNLFDELGKKAVYGTGFETAGSSIGMQLGVGLGGLGIGAGLIGLFGSIFAGLLNGRILRVLSWPIFGIAGLMLFAPSSVTLIGPILIVFLATLYRSIIAKQNVRTLNRVAR